MNAANLSGLITLLLLIAFVVGWVWAWSSKRKPDFDAAARLPLDDEARLPANRINTSQERAP